jgi:hypothetical protein
MCYVEKRSIEISLRGNALQYLLDKLTRQAIMVKLDEYPFSQR